MRHPITIPLVALSATLLFLTTPAFAQKENSDIENIGNRDINKGNRMMRPSLESEIAMGRAASHELESKVTLLQDIAVREYIDRVGQNIVRNSDAKVPFTIRVVDSEDISAIGLPGGFLYVNKGLILASDNEAELASVISREVAHVAARHAAEAQGKGSLLNVASVPLTGTASQSLAVQQAATIGVPLTLLAFVRTQEEEADFLGLQYLYKAGYDPDAMVTFFQKLQARENARKTSDQFATQPRTEDRIKQIQKNISTLPPTREQALITTGEFQAVKARLMNRN